ncbi:MAG: C39 family peptidase [Ruminococcus sp.]|nr:C39 family peptidase [Ruminococcus sp.]
MKKFILFLLLFALTSCGNKNQNSINPLGSTEITTATQSGIRTVTTTIQSTTEPVTKSRPIMKKKSMIDVPYYSQFDYPTGCELVSTSMLLAFLGFDIKAGELIEKGYLNAVDITEDSKKRKHGGDPDKVFIGNPEKNSGYGCYSGAIIYTLNKFLKPREYKSDTKYDIIDLKGTEIPEICADYISKGVPVIMWASIDMKPTFINLSNSWIIDKTGERYLWKSNEHCLILTGYDEEYYYFNDPLAQKDMPYLKRLAERRYGEMGMQAIAVIEN